MKFVSNKTLKSSINVVELVNKLNLLEVSEKIGTAMQNNKFNLKKYAHGDKTYYGFCVNVVCLQYNNVAIIVKGENKLSTIIYCILRKGKEIPNSFECYGTMIFYSWYGKTKNYDEFRKIALTKDEWKKIDKILG